MAVSPAAQAASVVLAATRPMPSKSMAESVLPGLKPYQPNHSSRPPLTAIVKSCGSMGAPPSLGESGGLADQHCLPAVRSPSQVSNGRRDVGGNGEAVKQIADES